ncbi:MAG: hypothetical protein ACYDH6_21165 [Acidimicrobiales bacterium]
MVEKRRRADIDPESPFYLASQDVHEGLADFFTPTQGFHVAAGFVEGPPMTNGKHTSVVWEFHGKHDAVFQGVRPTGRHVVIRGVTVVDKSKRGRVLFHRYVDWLDLMSQLGLSSTFRPALDELPGRRRSKA